MPCDTCKRRCEDECGFTPKFWDEWTTGGVEYCGKCDGYVEGDPDRDCDTCTNPNCGI